MAEFLQLLPPNQALEKYLKFLTPLNENELIKTDLSLGRVIGREYIAPHDLPYFRRSTVDGFAVFAADTYGASESNPAYLKIAYEVMMGELAEIPVNRGECCLIHTGGMVPDSADSVVMLEFSERINDQELEIYRAVAVGENIIQIGEDIKQGQVIFSFGDVIRPADLGGLMAFGFTEVEVVKKPTIGLISGGDEIIAPSTPLTPGKVRDINAYTIGSLVEQIGGSVKRYGIVQDDLNQLLSVAQTAKQECDMVIITAGSSASVRDVTADVINYLGKPGVIVHGVNIKPGKPTILGICDGKPVIGLPGNPVSALVIAQLLVEPTLKYLLNQRRRSFQPTVKAKLAANIASQAGREDWIAIKLQNTNDGLMALPLPGKSNLIFTLSKADGIVQIDVDATGIEAGKSVEVHLL